jgi:multimeric flavodoxin WrbA
MKMKIAVLNGSPKGDTSVTMQYVKYIRKEFGQHELKIINISQRIKKIEKDDDAFGEIIEQIESSDAVLWAFPLYFCLVPAQYKRFIELITERGVEKTFSGKFAAVLTTSIHFFDHTAHNYMNAICDDLDMNYLGYFSAEMSDLLKGDERTRLLQFAGNFFRSITDNIPTSKNYEPLKHGAFDYSPGKGKGSVVFGDRKVLLLTDCEEGQTNLVGMIERFRSSFSADIEVVNLNEVDIKGGCLGCIRCGYENICAYGDSDGYMEFYNTKVKPADLVIFAGAIKDRYLSSKWKMFFDRSFFNTHIPTLIDKQVGVLISGSLRQIPNLRQIFESYPEWQQANLAGIITDECEDSAELDLLLQSFAERMIRMADEGYKQPHNFLGVAGMKIFRDDIFGQLRFVFQADHKYYKKHGRYDFPQYDWKTRVIVFFMMLLTKIPPVRKDIYQKMKQHMIAPFAKIIKG